MEHFVHILNTLADTFFGPTNPFMPFFLDGNGLSLAGNGLALAFSLGVASIKDSPEAILTNLRRWRGGIEDKYTAINTLVLAIQKNQPAWTIPKELLDKLLDNHVRLRELILKSKESSGSANDRAERNTLLRETVKLCQMQVKIWAYNGFATGMLTAEDIHLIGFRLPGEIGGYRRRSIPTQAEAFVRAYPIDAEFIHVVIDRSATVSTSQRTSAWPDGVRYALIIILTADGKTEVYRGLTTCIHNDIEMPKSARGKQFIIKAAFLKHVNDKPKFGNEPTLSMPLMTEDLASHVMYETESAPLKQEIERQQQEIENQRQEIEYLKAQLKLLKGQ